MERIVSIVICTGIIVLLCVGLGRADTQVILNPMQDTWINTNRTSTSGVNFSDVSHGTETTINLGLGIGTPTICAGSGNCAFWLFNVSSIQGKIIRPTTGYALWNWTKSSGYTGTSGGYTRLRLLNNVTWNETLINGTSLSYYPNLTTTAYLFGGAHDIDLHNFRSSKNLTVNSTLISYIYNASDGIITIASDGYRNVGSDVDTLVYSKEDGSNRGAKLTFFNLTDYMSDYSSITDTRGVCFDFESQTFYENGTVWTDCATPLPEWDYFYDLTNNVIVPKEPMSFYSRDNTATNQSLSNLDCNLLSPGAYTYNQYSNVNPPATPKLYDMFCFNQSYVHAVPGFYGAIKVFNNSNVRYSLKCPAGDCPDFDFAWGFYSPDFTTFSAPVLIPNPPVADIELTVQWTTTKNMNGWVTFRYNDSGNMSPYYTITDLNDTYRTYHIVIIPPSYIKSFYYEYTLNGNISDGTDFSSIVYNFTVGQSSNYQTYITENTTITSVIDNMVANGLVPDAATARLFIAALITAGFAIFATMMGGPKFGAIAFVTMLVTWIYAFYVPTSFIVPIVLVAAMILAKTITKLWG